MIKKYKTIYEKAEVENIIEKSKFIGYVKPIENEDEAIEFIEEIKSLHKNANHNVPVYVYGENYEIQRYSDDGEPSGTAGVPVLEMLKKEEIKNTAIVITRYFGGIKLGTGGLVRAYTSTAKLALCEAKIIEKVLHDLIKVRLEYSMLGKVQNFILSEGYYLKDTTFDDAVNIYIYSEVDKTQSLYNSITNLTNGNAILSKEETDYLNMSDGKIINK